MSKTKSSKIPHYELLYIVSNKFSEDEVKPIVEKINKAISDNGGTITFSEDWGKKRLAYSIEGFYYGYYLLAEFDMPGEKLAGLDRFLRLSNEIVRYVTVAKKVRSAAEIARDQKIATKIAAKTIEEEKVAQEKTTAKEKDKDKIDLKDLDDKLDKILDSSDLL